VIILHRLFRLTRLFDCLVIILQDCVAKQECSVIILQIVSRNETFTKPMGSAEVSNLMRYTTVEQSNSSPYIDVKSKVCMKKIRFTLLRNFCEYSFP